MLRNDDVEMFEERDGERLVWVDRDHRLNVAHFFVAVDPSGGGPSAFSICSLALAIRSSGAPLVFFLSAALARAVFTLPLCRPAKLS